jgi:hypothetical protein
MNKSSSRYRRLMEIRSRNSFRKKGFTNVKTSYILDIDLNKLMYKDWIILI